MTSPQLEAQVEVISGASFQSRVKPWMADCFGPEISADRHERNFRFIEEALELIQACGATASEAHQLVDYVFNRPVGEPEQEVGGVMTTLAALCLANDLDMHQAADIELARISSPEVMEKIRRKQASKPKHSPLPEHVAPKTTSSRTLPYIEPEPHTASDYDPGMVFAPLCDAIRRLSTSAAELRRCHTIDGDWSGEPEAKADYDQTQRLVDDLRALRATLMPAAQANESNCADAEVACEAAWRACQDDVGTEGWTASEKFNFRGFFMHGWRAAMTAPVK